MQVWLISLHFFKSTIERERERAPQNRNTLAVVEIILNNIVNKLCANDTANSIKDIPLHLLTIQGISRKLKYI